MRVLAAYMPVRIYGFCHNPAAKIVQPLIIKISYLILSGYAKIDAGTKNCMKRITQMMRKIFHKSSMPVGRRIVACQALPEVIYL